MYMIITCLLLVGNITGICFLPYKKPQDERTAPDRYKCINSIKGSLHGF